MDTEETSKSTEIQEFTETPITQDMGEPSGIQTRRRSEGIEEPGESTGIAGNQEPTDLPTTGASTDQESLAAQTDEKSFRLDRQIGALVPVESSHPRLPRSYSYPEWCSNILSLFPDHYYQWFLSWFSPASQTHEEEHGKNLCNGDEGNEDGEVPGSGFEHISAEAAEGNEDGEIPDIGPKHVDDPSEDELSQFKGAEGNGDGEDSGSGSKHVDDSCEGAEGNGDGEDSGSGADHSECAEGNGDGEDSGSGADHSESSIDCKQVGINGKSFKENIDEIRKIIESTFNTLLYYIQTRHTVGIFSRSSGSDYEWLINELKSKPFHSTVSIVCPHYISNNRKREFMDAVSGCTFGILYHTKNRGRINIVDVTDSLYDEELKYLSDRLGRENVIVVVDDLEDTSDGEKTRILETQPSIGTLARDLILFSANDKPVMTISEIIQES